MPSPREIAASGEGEGDGDSGENADRRIGLVAGRQRWGTIEKSEGTLCTSISLQAVACSGIVFGSGTDLYITTLVTSGCMWVLLINGCYFWTYANDSPDWD